MAPRKMLPRMPALLEMLCGFLGMADKLNPEGKVKGKSCLLRGKYDQSVEGAL